MIAVAKKVGGWLIKNPSYLFIIFLTIAGSVVVLGKNSDIAYLKKQVKVAEKARDTANIKMGFCQANVSSVKASLKTQNAAIEDMAAAAAAREAQFDVVMAGIAKDRAATGRVVNDLLKRPAPDDKCAGADQLIKDTAQ